MPRSPAVAAVVTRSRRWWSASEPLSSCEAVCAHVHSGLLLANHAPQYARCARRPLPAMARSRSSSPAAKRRHSSRGNKIAQPAILRFAAGQGCGSVVAALTDRHQGRDGRGLGNSNRRSPWLRLAPSPEDGSYTGTIKTLSLNIKARFLPAEPSENEKAPNLRVMAGNVEIGAAWQRTSKDNTVYHSVKLDDPFFSAPIYANLVAVDDGYALVWSR
jgi:uncharacterized protein (DUF736 family)